MLRRKEAYSGASPGSPQHGGWQADGPQAQDIQDQLPPWRVSTPTPECAPSAHHRWIATQGEPRGLNATPHLTPSLFSPHRTTIPGLATIQGPQQPSLLQEEGAA